jgi:hypothetical protein
MAADYLVLSRHGIFYFRRCVPFALRGVLRQQQITFSLRTTNRREARLRVRACAAASDGYFLGVAAMAKKNRDDGVVTTNLTMKFGLDEHGNPWFNVDAEPDEIEAAKALIGSASEAMAAVKASTSGTASAAVPRPRAPSTSTAGGPTLQEAITAFAAGHQVKSTTARRYAPALARLQTFLGASTPLASITQSKFAEYAADVKATEGSAAKTKNMTITTGGTFFKWCSSRYDNAPAISTNTLKIKRHAPQRDERGAFTLNELLAILDAAATLRTNVQSVVSVAESERGVGYFRRGLAERVASCSKGRARTRQDASGARRAVSGRFGYC